MRLGPRLLFPTRAIRCRDAEKLTSSFFTSFRPPSRTPECEQLVSGNFSSFLREASGRFLCSHVGQKWETACKEPLRTTGRHQTAQEKPVETDDGIQKCQNLSPGVSDLVASTGHKAYCLKHVGSSICMSRLDSKLITVSVLCVDLS